MPGGLQSRRVPCRSTRRRPAARAGPRPGVPAILVNWSWARFSWLRPGSLLIPYSGSPARPQRPCFSPGDPAPDVAGHLHSELHDMEQVRHEHRGGQHPADRRGADGAHADGRHLDVIPPRRRLPGQPVRGVISRAALDLAQQPMVPGQVKQDRCASGPPTTGTRRSAHRPASAAGPGGARRSAGAPPAPAAHPVTASSTNHQTAASPNVIRRPRHPG